MVIVVVDSSSLSSFVSPIVTTDASYVLLRAIVRLALSLLVDGGGLLNGGPEEVVGS